MDLYDQINYSLIGELEDDAALDWVPNAFAPGSICEQAYARLLLARDRLLRKLGVEDDPDLEQLLLRMNEIQRTLCRHILELRKLE